MSNTSTHPVATVWLIVPIYNAARYLHECLASIAGQTYHDLHVLLIDDGSTDNSAEIAAQFCSADSRFELIQIANHGVSYARNLGIDRARGQYLGFVDADDCLYPHSIELLVKALISTGSQVAVGRFVAANRFHQAKIKGTSPATMSYIEAMQAALYQSVLINAPWGMLMERSLLGDDLRFDTTLRYEDLDAFYRFYQHAKRIALLREPVYFYRQSTGSFMHQWSPQRLDALTVTDRIVDFMTEHYPSLRPAALDRQFSAHCNILLLMLRYNICIPEARQRCINVIRTNRAAVLRDPRVRFKNRLGALLSYIFIR